MRKKQLFIIWAMVILALLPAVSAFAGGGKEAVSAKPKHDKPLQLDIFSNAANYQGLQAGWFAVVVKEKFNLTLNILAPQISGDQLYQTRAAAGDLGDIVIIDNAQWVDCIPAGLVAPLDDWIAASPNLSKYKNHFKVFNESFGKVTSGKIYGMPDFEADTSPTSYSDFQPYSSPELYWPWYRDIGMPQIKNLNDLLDAMEKMYKLHPKTADGKPHIPVTIWKDWDTNYMEAACWIGQWYGYQCDNTCSSVQLGVDGKIVPMSDDSSSYKKGLQFLFQCNQRGLMDPDAASQQWMDVNTKYTNGQVNLMWYSWSRGFYNSTDKAAKGDGWIVVPISDLNIAQSGDAYYGGGRVWCLGSKAKDPARTMEFIDWLNSPEGMRYVHDGIKDFVYELSPDGKTFQYTKLGWNAFTQNTPVPAQYGGGGYQNGISAINTCIMSDLTIDPATGVFFNTAHWPAEIEKNKNQLTNEWAKRFGAANPTEYFLKNKNMTVVMNINADLGKDSTDIQTIRSQCAQILKDTSWQMVFAADQAAFDKLWKDMRTQLDGLGWAQLVKSDTAKSQRKVELRKAGSK
jgi:putative aldouronate transport system substrate-binding protein